MAIHVAAAIAALRVGHLARTDEAIIAVRALRRWLGNGGEPVGFCGYATPIPKFRRGGLPKNAAQLMADDAIRLACLAVHFHSLPLGVKHARNALDRAVTCHWVNALRSAGKGPARPRMRVADEAEALERKMQAEDFKTLGIQE